MEERVEKKWNKIRRIFYVIFFPRDTYKVLNMQRMLGMKWKLQNGILTNNHSKYTKTE